MSGGSKEELGTLYFELGDLLARKGQLAEAADSYALAMYYARRVNNLPLTDLCREQILACHPNHVAVRENNAPLFFAQLLMRYPAEEASVRLNKLRREVDETPQPAVSMPEPIPTSSPYVMAGPEAIPAGPMTSAPPARGPIHPPITPAFGTAPRSTPVAGGGIAALDIPAMGSQQPHSSGGLASLFGPATPSRAWGENVTLPLAEPGRAPSHPPTASVGHAGFEQHHPFAFGLADPSVASRRVINEFEPAPMRPAPMPIPVQTMASESFAPPRSRVSAAWRWLEPVAGLFAVAGMAASGFFAYKLWPEINKLDTKRYSAIVDEAVQDSWAWYMENYGAALAQRESALNPSAVPSVDVNVPMHSAEVTDMPMSPPPTATDSLPPLMEESPTVPRALPSISTAGGAALPSAPPGWEAPKEVAQEPESTTTR